MIENHYQAADEIAALLIPVAAAESWPVAWPNLEFTKPAMDTTWLRFNLAFTDGGQSTLAGASGKSRFAKSGVLLIDVFTPLGKGLRVPLEAAQKVMAAYEGKRTASDVWFRNVRIDGDGGLGRGGDAAWWQTNVSVNFQYDNLN